MQDIINDILNAKAVCNWYIDNTKDRIECYHGLGSLNNFLYVLYGYSYIKTSKVLFKDKVSVKEIGPVFEQMLANYEDQAQNLCKPLDYTGRDILPHEENLLQEAYDIFSRFKPQKLKQIITDEDSPWYKITNNLIETESKLNINAELIATDVKRVILIKDRIF